MNKTPEQLERKVKQRREYYWAHREREIQYNRQWRAAHPDAMRACRKKWAAAHPDVIRGYSKAYRAAHPEAIRAADKKWRDAYPEAIRAHNAVNNGIRGGTVFRPDSCSICGKVGRLDGHHPDYTKPLDVVWLCQVCHKKEKKEGG